MEVNGTIPAPAQDPPFDKQVIVVLLMLELGQRGRWKKKNSNGQRTAMAEERSG
jgi:hypothetical protein